MPRRAEGAERLDSEQGFDGDRGPGPRASGFAFSAASLEEPSGVAKAALAGSASQGFEGELEAVSEEELAAHMASYEAWVAGLEARQRARQEALMAGLGATEEDPRGCSV